jgi:HNH endonuclease
MRADDRKKEIKRYAAEAAAGALDGSALATLLSLKKVPRQTKKQLLTSIGAEKRGGNSMLSLHGASLVKREKEGRGFVFWLTDAGEAAIVACNRRRAEVSTEARENGNGIRGTETDIPDVDNVQLNSEDADSAYVPSDDDSRDAVMRKIRARRGQQKFRNELRKRYGDQCMISRCQLLDVVEAAHIKPYQGLSDNHPANGLLLRADLHTLFDLDLIGVDPETLRIHVHTDAKEDYGKFDGVELTCDAARPSSTSLALRWTAFQSRQD